MSYMEHIARCLRDGSKPLGYRRFLRIRDLAEAV